MFLQEVTAKTSVFVFIIKTVTPMTAVLSAWRSLFTDKFCFHPFPAIYQRSSLFIQNASLKSPCSPDVSEVARPAEIKLRILSAERVLLAFSLDVSGVALSLSEMKNSLCFSLLPSPKARVTAGQPGLGIRKGQLARRFQIKCVTHKSRLMTSVEGRDEERVTRCDGVMADEPQTWPGHCDVMSYKATQN